jgi:hypothetical protein
MTTARGFFYDDCKSGDRLAREYTAVVGPTPTAYLDGSIPCYKWVSAAGGTHGYYITIDSFLPSGDFEIFLKFKKNIQIYPDSPALQIYYTFRSTVDSFQFGYSDQSYFNRLFPGGSVYCTQTWPRVVPSDTWFNFRGRFTTALSKTKYWQVGLAEINWDVFTSKSIGTSGTERPIHVTRPPGDGKIGIGYVSFGVGDYIEIADIRITPVPKTGGP